jgi:hypothetical protein
MYFPKSQIKTNLHTTGDDNTYILSTTKKEYIGYYYEVSNGQKFTGKTPQDGPNILLLLEPFVPLMFQDPNKEPKEVNEKYLSTDYNPPIIPAPPYNSTITPIRYLPQPTPTFPTNQETRLGVYTRYFCKKNNELKYMEIDKLTFDKLSARTQDIAWDLYTPISTLWYLRAADVNKNLVSLIEREQKWYGFTQWFKDNFF